MVLEAAGAGEGVEQAGADRALGEDGLEGIEEGATGGFGREGAEQTEAEVVLIGETGAVTGQLARDREVQQGLKKESARGAECYGRVIITINRQP